MQGGAVSGVEVWKSTCKIAQKNYNDKKCWQLERGGIDVGTTITLVILLAVVGMAVRSMVRDRKKGRSLQCGGDCSKCKGCH